MKTLFALELKKLTKKRMNIIVITVCLILAGILFYDCDHGQNLHDDIQIIGN